MLSTPFYNNHGTHSILAAHAVSRSLSVIFELWLAYLAVWVPELVHTHGQKRGFLFGFGFQ